MTTVAELLFATAPMSRLEAAVAFAGADLPVFPCVPGGKRPLTRAGFHDATVLEHQVEAWWRRWPQANIGMPTGRRSGVDVVDVDVKAGGSGYAAFKRAVDDGVAQGEFARVRTPSGGMHVYYPNDGAQHPCWQSARAHIDFRGEGGYVLIPPSSVVSNDGVASYRVASLTTGGVAGIDPIALRGFVDPLPPSPIRSGPADRGNYAALAVWVSHLRQGERNRGLFWAACRMFDAGATPPQAMGILTPAAEEVGLEQPEIVTTIRSAWRRSGYDAAIRDLAGYTSPETPRRRPDPGRSLS